MVGRHRLPPMAWEEGDRAPGNVDLFAGAFDPLPITFENERDRLNRLLRSIYKEKTFPLSVALSLTEDFDRLCFLASADPEGLIEDMVHLRRVVIDKMRTRCTAS